MTQQRELLDLRERLPSARPVVRRDRPAWPVPTPPPDQAAAPSGEAGSESWIRPGRTLLVASTGGHLDELYQLRKRFRPVLDEVEWATFDTPQARQLLADEVVHYVPYAKSRDARGALLDGVEAIRLLGSHRFVRVISTGAAVAVPFLGLARGNKLAAHYIESAARSEGLSLSGQMVSKLPGVRMYGQYPSWTSGRVQFRGSVFDGFTQGAPRPPGPLDKVVVTFGTQRDFGFRRALEALVRVLPEVCSPSVEILWQTGSTDTSGLPVKGVAEVSRRELEQAMSEADLVVSHSGVGTALMALEQGRCPLLMPRRQSFSEHADDHQRLIAEELGRRGLAIWADPHDLTIGDLEVAARMRAVGSAEPPPFLLQPD
jgi:UDP-N-acetylglucosamine--N-acetylmuramyl-(pentapeptide) pyrophosphoryl-undecaprenol N-acetylglucosamine transferase